MQLSSAAGGRVTAPPDAADRCCRLARQEGGSCPFPAPRSGFVFLPDRRRGGRSPPACAAGSSAAMCGCALCNGAPPRSRSAGGLGEDRGATSSPSVPAPSQDPAACSSLWSKFPDFWRLYLLKRAMICWSSAGYRMPRSIYSHFVTMTSWAALGCGNFTDFPCFDDFGSFEEYWWMEQRPSFMPSNPTDPSSAQQPPRCPLSSKCESACQALDYRLI
ncbi:uncharacterized protein [Vicugna pacos]|uniref:Uncharacterized protein n=1 Tax=Vicugna pacos TaxID=30538 RepID=A0ABM5DL93_VICPA